MSQPFIPVAWKVLEKWNTPVLRFLLGLCLIVAGVWVAATPPPQQVIEVSRHPHPANGPGHTPGTASPAHEANSGVPSTGPRSESHATPATTAPPSH